MAGPVAQHLAGFKPRGFESDAEHFGQVWLYLKDSKRSTKEALAGA